MTQPADPTTAALVLDAGRVRYIRMLCERALKLDIPQPGTVALSDRAWLAQAVLNIMDGNIDQQILAEAGQT